MIIKQLPEKDLAKCYAFQKNYTHEENSFSYWKKKYVKYPKLFVGGYEGKKLIGICVGRPRGKEVVLTSIAVNSKYQKKSGGKKLLRYFEKQAKTLGKNRISMGSAKNVVKFYAKSGYKIIKKKKNCTIMEKKI